MNGHQTLFFMTNEDLFPILDELHSKIDFNYILYGSHESLDIPIYNHYSQIQNLGFTNFKNMNLIESYYLLFKKNNTILIKEKPQRDGGVRYITDIELNLESILFAYGGISTLSPKSIVAGKITYVYENDFNKRLFNLMSQLIKKISKRIDRFYIGPDAYQKMNEGWTLYTHNEFTLR